MIIKSISYQKVKNLGNYESERLEATATIEEGESASKAFNQLRAFVELHLNALGGDDDDDDHNPLFDNVPADNF